jgi:hypothetical protein
MDVEKLKRMAGAVRTGGKGSMRRCFIVFFWALHVCSIYEALVSSHVFHFVGSCACLVSVTK